MSAARPYWVAIVLLTAGCVHVPESCPIGSAHAAVVNAGCLAVVKGRLLVVEDWRGKVTPPGGAGEAGEGGECTAYRETWEETGQLWQPMELLDDFGGQFYLYRCEPLGTLGPLSPPMWWEIRRARYISPAEFDEQNWRFPDQVDRVRQLFEQAVTE